MAQAAALVVSLLVSCQTRVSGRGLAGAASGSGFFKPTGSLVRKIGGARRRPASIALRIASAGAMNDGIQQNIVASEVGDG